MRQSAATWFQPASATSASASGRSASSIRPMSEGAIALAIAGRLAEAREIARDPVGGPVDHLRERHLRIAEQPHRLRRVDQPGGPRFLALEGGLPAEALA